VFVQIFRRRDLDVGVAAFHHADLRLGVAFHKRAVIGAGVAVADGLFHARKNQLGAEGLRRLGLAQGIPFQSAGDVAAGDRLDGILAGNHETGGLFAFHGRQQPVQTVLIQIGTGAVMDQDDIADHRTQAVGHGFLAGAAAADQRDAAGETLVDVLLELFAVGDDNDLAAAGIHQKERHRLFQNRAVAKIVIDLIVA